MTLQERLDKLIEERKAIVVKMDTLLEKESLTDEDNTEYDTLNVRNGEIKKHIERLDAQIADASEMRESVSKVILPDPNATADSTIRATEIKDRPYVYKSLGLQLFDVANFTTGRDRNSEKRLKESRSILSQEERAITGLGNMNPSEAGFLVQQDFSDVLIQRTHESGIVNSRCDHKTIGANANSFTQNYLAETSRADGFRGGGIAAYWKNEGTDFTASHPKFGQINLALDKLTALCYATDENLADATQLESIIMEAYPKEINYKLDDAVINGDGVTKPLGFLNSVYPSGMTVSVAKETDQAADTLCVENINHMWNALLGSSRKNAIWLINQDAEYQLDMLEFPVGTGGLPGYLPPGGLSVEGYSALKGRPVFPVEQCPALGDVGDIMLVDLSSYLVIEKGGIQAASSIHVAFVSDQSVFRFVYRTNGQPKFASAITAAKGGTARSECVVLDARA